MAVEYEAQLARLAVRVGANVQPDQVVAISSEPGKEGLTRAIAAEAYDAGARFVDLSVFDVHLKRLRALKADPETLGYVPPWLGERVLALGEHRCARIGLTGPAAPRIMDDVEPGRLGRDMLPRVRESNEVVNAHTTNWTLLPCPAPEWAAFVHPGLHRGEALQRLWDQVAHVCRLDEADPVAAWQRRLDQLRATATRLDDLRLDAVRLRGPGTDLTIGLLPSSRWLTARMQTVDGIVHVANLPTEEVFTSPDPERTQGTVTSTKPLFASGTAITGLRMHFEHGRAVGIEADQGADVVRELAQRDPGAARLGELALVDRESRIGATETTFFDTLLDENAASHIALGHGFSSAVADHRDRERVNSSSLHLDFMIGSDELEVTGIATDASQPSILREGRWQLDGAGAQ